MKSMTINEPLSLEEQMFQALAPTKKSGFLNENYRLFYIKDKRSSSFDYHYHDFHKIIFMRHGIVDYEIEGRKYSLKSRDILFVPLHSIHKPTISDEKTYERMVLWISDSFLREIFGNSETNYNNFISHSLMRTNFDTNNNLWEILQMANKQYNINDFGAIALHEAYIKQFLIYLIREVLSPDFTEDEYSIHYDEKIDQILNYINENINSKLSNEDIANHFYISKYYLMHKFKQYTGYTLHYYIEQKRLILAAQLLNSGMNASRACEQSGFMDYSTFVRAFKKKYGISPSKY